MRAKGRISEQIEQGDNLRCYWHTVGHGQCKMLGTIAPNGQKFYCLWHYKSLNDIKWATDYEQFIKWREKLIDNYPHISCRVKETNCSQRQKYPTCNWDQEFCPPRGSQWHYDIDEIWYKILGG